MDPKEYFTEQEQTLFYMINKGWVNLEDHEALYEKLFRFYEHEMPYGTQKARTGDPYCWIYERLKKDFPND